MLDEHEPHNGGKRTGKDLLSTKWSDHGSRTLGLFFLVKFAVLWSTFTLFFDYLMYFRDVVPQFRTVAFIAVDAEVLSCGKKVDQDADGVSHTGVTIEYKYRVAGQDYTSTRLRYLEYWTNFGADEFVATHRPGTMMTAFYDPRNPSAAVVEAGCDGRDLFLPLILLPFNVIMIGLGYLAVAGMRKGIHGLQAAYHGFRVLETAEEYRIRLTTISPAAATVLVLVVAPLAATVFMACFVGVPRGLGSAATAWAAVLACAAATYAYVASRADSGEYDLVIDRIAGTLLLPRRLIGGKSVVISSDWLLSVKAASSAGAESHQHSVSVEWRDTSGQVQAATLATSLAPEQVRNLVEWICRNMGLPHE
jgi:hypothetical protein